ncbi:hypothetical protein [Amycolatopsis sp. NPDC004079]|uniref:hypothetical protein n=1 Tax=Amycolatopsis sp. NPDC004079 TaxID=3154549 RepID=UPI0033B73DB8
MPTDAEVDARIKECWGRWPQVSGDRDELTMLARARRNKLIGLWHAQGRSPQWIARKNGMAIDTVKRLIKAQDGLAAGRPSGPEPTSPAPDRKPPLPAPLLCGAPRSAEPRGAAYAD